MQFFLQNIENPKYKKYEIFDNETLFTSEKNSISYYSEDKEIAYFTFKNPTLIKNIDKFIPKRYNLTKSIYNIDQINELNTKTPTKYASLNQEGILTLFNEDDIFSLKDGIEYDLNTKKTTGFSLNSAHEWTSFKETQTTKDIIQKEVSDCKPSKNKNRFIEMYEGVIPESKEITYPIICNGKEESITIILFKEGGTIIKEISDNSYFPQQEEEEEASTLSLLPTAITLSCCCCLPTLIIAIISFYAIGYNPLLFGQKNKNKPKKK